MKNKLLLLFLLAFSFSGMTQQDSVQTIVISKAGTKLYRGTDDEILNWYFYIDETGYSYLANLEIAEEELEKWFETRKNSDNIFKSNTLTEDGALIFLSKVNEPDVVLTFRVLVEQNKLLIFNMDDEKYYHFEKINIQR
ncbi:MAG: hypothetical protein K0R65_1450 [Crocinitomicaceae bacterium]|jgi:hypothetical protein|nr:hypothetical protein [Crocinitomicaceae bacterium]